MCVWCLLVYLCATVHMESFCAPPLQTTPLLSHRSWCAHISGASPNRQTHPPCQAGTRCARGRRHQSDYPCVGRCLGVWWVELQMPPTTVYRISLPLPQALTQTSLVPALGCEDLHFVSMTISMSLSYTVCSHTYAIQRSKHS